MKIIVLKFWAQIVKSLKNDQVCYVNEFLRKVLYFYQNICVEIKLRVQRISKLNYDKRSRILAKSAYELRFEIWYWIKRQFFLVLGCQP